MLVDLQQTSVTLLCHIDRLISPYIPQLTEPTVKNNSSASPGQQPQCEVSTMMATLLLCVSLPKDFGNRFLVFSIQIIFGYDRQMLGKLQGLKLIYYLPCLWHIVFITFLCYNIGSYLLTGVWLGLAGLESGS